MSFLKFIVQESSLQLPLTFFQYAGFFRFIGNGDIKFFFLSIQNTAGKYQ